MGAGTKWLKKQEGKLGQFAAEYSKAHEAELLEFMVRKLYPDLIDAMVQALVADIGAEEIRKAYEELLKQLNELGFIDDVIKAVLEGLNEVYDKLGRRYEIKIVRPYVVQLKEFLTTNAYLRHAKEMEHFKRWAFEATTYAFEERFNKELYPTDEELQKAKEAKFEMIEDNLEEDPDYQKYKNPKDKTPINQKNSKNKKQAGGCDVECTIFRRNRRLEGGGELVCDPLDSDAPSPGSQLNHYELPHDEWDTVNPDYADKMDSGYEHADDGDSCDSDEQCGRIGNYCCQNVCYDGSYYDHCDYDADCARMGNYCQHVAGQIFQVGRCMRGLEGDDCNPGDPCVSGGYCNAENNECMFEGTYVEGESGPETACPDYDASCTSETAASVPAQFASDLIISIIENPLK